jgi:hypothetical protein
MEYGIDARGLMNLNLIKPVGTTFILTAFASLTGSLFIPESAATGRYVLNQTPATIEKSFGRYWTKLTQKGSDGKIYVTYWYSPAKLRRLFPDRPETKLMMIYVDDRVQSVQIIPYKTPQEVGDGSVKMDSSIFPSLKMEERYFEAIFGYKAPIYKPLYLSYGSFYSYQNCLGNGVRSSYAFHFGERLISGISFAYDKTCEPPYDQIKFTEEKGPSGG